MTERAFLDRSLLRVVVRFSRFGRNVSILLLGRRLNIGRNFILRVDGRRSYKNLMKSSASHPERRERESLENSPVPT